MRHALFALMLLPLASLPRQDMNYLLDYDARIHIVTKGIEGSEGAGSGVYIANDVILTAAHLANVEGGRFFLDDAHTIEATILKIDTEVDLMTLQVSGKHKSAKLGRPPRRLDSVLAVGHPMGNATTIMMGRIADSTSTQLLVDVTVIGGMSGGGIYTPDGRLVGISSMSWGDDNSKLLVATSVAAIKKFLGK